LIDFTDHKQIRSCYEHCKEHLKNHQNGDSKNVSEALALLDGIFGDLRVRLLAV
jgi:hypothetical protein